MHGVTRPGTIPTEKARIKPRVCRSRRERLNHQAIEAVLKDVGVGVRDGEGGGRRGTNGLAMTWGTIMLIDALKTVVVRVVDAAVVVGSLFNVPATCCYCWLVE